MAERKGSQEYVQDKPLDLSVGVVVSGLTSLTGVTFNNFVGKTCYALV